MAKEEDEQWNVSVKVLVGDGKYREYRLPNSLCTDRSTLWGAKHEVGQRIADIVRDKKLKIGELKRCIQKIELSQSIWLTLAKNVNGKTENFFLDALSASEENLEKFEQLNFFSKQNWSKIRDVEELSELEKDELSLINNVGDPYETDDVNENGENKLRHYEWMCKKSVGSSSSRQQSTEGEDRSVSSSTEKETTSNDFPKTEKRDVVAEVLPNTSQSVGNFDENIVKGEENDTGINQNDLKKDPDDECAIPTTIKNSVPIIKKSERTHIENNFEGKQRKNIKHSDDISTEPVVWKLGENKKSVEEKEIQSCSTNVICSQETTNTDSRQIITRFTVDSSQQTKDVTYINQVDAVIKTEQLDQQFEKSSNTGKSGKPLETNLPPENQKPSVQVKKPLADVSGYSRLRLTSGSATEVKPIPVVVTKVCGSIWEQKAAERERKLLEEKYEQQYPKAGAQTNGNSSSIGDAVIKPTRETVQNGINSKRSAKKTRREHYKTETPKTSDSNGWITFSAKKGGRPTNGTFLKDLEKQESLSVSNRSNEESVISSSMQSLDSNPQMSNTPTENVMNDVENKVSDEPKHESQLYEPSTDDMKAEKRAKRRQRVHEKVKLSAKQNKEEEKKLKEQKRIEHELQILSEKREKEVRQRLEYEQKRAEIERIKRERENKLLTRKQKGCEPSKVQDMLASRERLIAHVQEKPLPYRMIGSKIFIDKRLPELAVDRSMEINRNKFKILHTYRGRLRTMERMNTFLIFMNNLAESTKDFSLDQLLDYFTSSSLDLNQKPENAVHEAIRKTFIKFCKEHTIKKTENMEKALQFADSLLQKVSKMRKKSDMIEKTNKILTNYKLLHTEAIDIMGLTSYLWTRMDTELFIMEEDYLLTVNESELCGYQGAVTDDEEEFEKPEVHDMCCQTDGETYDVKAASMMPLVD